MTGKGKCYRTNYKEKQSFNDVQKPARVVNLGVNKIYNLLQLKLIIVIVITIAIVIAIAIAIVIVIWSTETACDPEVCDLLDFFWIFEIIWTL